MSSSCVSRRALGLAALGAALLLPATSEAHFYLQSPAAATEQNDLGDPQKAPPCGDDGTAVLTGEVTSFKAGDTITITIDERIYHPGHYRIALVADINDLPDPPPVTPGTTPCGSAPIDPDPQFPVLADGVFEHTESFSEPQTIEVTIPDDLSCDNCTLQVIQFMSNHALNDPGGCYYHHCATIAVEGDPVGATSTGDDTGPATDDGPTATTAPADSSTGNGSNASDGPSATSDPGDDTNGGPLTALPTTEPSSDSDDSGCSCSVPSGDRSARFGAALMLLGLLRLRRRR